MRIIRTTSRDRDAAWLADSLPSMPEALGGGGVLFCTEGKSKKMTDKLKGNEVEQRKAPLA